jgi:hypothetical protein
MTIKIFSQTAKQVRRKKKRGLDWRRRDRTALSERCGVDEQKKSNQARRERKKQYGSAGEGFWKDVKR